MANLPPFFFFRKGNKWPISLLQFLFILCTQDIVIDVSLAILTKCVLIRSQMIAALIKITFGALGSKSQRDLL